MPKIPTGNTELCSLCEIGVATEFREARVTDTYHGICKVNSVFFTCDYCLCDYCNGDQLSQNQSEYRYYTPTDGV